MINNYNYQSKTKGHNFFMALFISILLLTFFIFSSVNVKASNNGSVGYSVAKIASKNEIKSTNAFYDLKVKPKKQYSIAAKIYNATDKNIKVKSQIFTTFTNNNGQIAYTNQAKTYDKSLKYKASDFIKVDKNDQVAKVPAKGSRVVHATINTPKNINGINLGSWYFSKTNQEGKKKTKGISINNKYSYAIAVKMTSNKKPYQFPDLHLLDVKAGLNNYRKVVNAVIQNNKPTIIKGMKVKSTVLRKNTGEVVFNDFKDDISMAPNSNYKFSSFANDKQLTAGDYTLKLKASYQGRHWNWIRDFSISYNQANNFNKKAKNDTEPPISIWWYVAGIILLIIFIVFITWLVVYLIMRKKNKED